MRFGDYSNDIWHGNESDRETRFYGVSHAPIPRGVVPASPIIFGTSNMCTQSLKEQHILHGDEIRCEESLYTVHHEC